MNDVLVTCIAFIGGTGDVVKNGDTGLLIPQGDRDRLEAAVRSLLEDGKRSGRPLVMAAPAAPARNILRPELPIVMRRVRCARSCP